MTNPQSLYLYSVSKTALCTHNLFHRQSQRRKLMVYVLSLFTIRNTNLGGKFWEIGKNWKERQSLTNLFLKQQVGYFNQNKGRSHHHKPSFLPLNPWNHILGFPLYTFLGTETEPSFLDETYLISLSTHWNPEFIWTSLGIAPWVLIGMRVKHLQEFSVWFSHTPFIKELVNNHLRF